MGISSTWNSFSLWIMQAGLPLVSLYHAVCSDPFLNVSAQDAHGLEKIANVCLIPAQYVLVGKKAVPDEQGGYCLEQEFSYEDSGFWVKTIVASCMLPPSLLLGSALKGMALLSPQVRERQNKINFIAKLGGKQLLSNRDKYRSLGIEFCDINQLEAEPNQGYERRPEDIENLKLEKEALKEIVALLNAHEIPYWIDCGSCLGAYRYGGNIPWDWDIDLAILQPDSDNVRNVLSKLDPNKYTVQDWSNRDNPKTYLKVYVKEAKALIDIYHFAIDEENRQVRSILAHEKSVFLPESWKIRERRYTIATPLSYIFPLKKMDFDGVAVFVPNQTEKYLQQRYGENIGPVKIYNPITQQYEKDPSHPFWQQQFVNER